jgi:hypothetical protein
MTCWRTVRVRTDLDGMISAHRPTQRAAALAG